MATPLCSWSYTVAVDHPPDTASPERLCTRMAQLLDVIVPKLLGISCLPLPPSLPVFSFGLSFCFRCLGCRRRRPWPFLFCRGVWPGCTVLPPRGGGGAFRIRRPQVVVQCLLPTGRASVCLSVWLFVSMSVVVCPVSVCLSVSVSVCLPNYSQLLL